MEPELLHMILVLGGFICIAALAAGLVYAVFTYGFKYTNATDTLLFWLVASGLAVILAGLFVNYVTQTTDITFIDR